MSPLASEILDDLPVEFTDGASILMLRNWLGETSVSVRLAVSELLDARLIYAFKGRFFAGASAPLGGPHRAYSVRA
jgi:hypothetical protein